MSQIVVIAGMHRSGTSMITRLLNRCGIHLGAESDMISPEPDNPEGYWENAQFIKLNDEILSTLNGGWDFPPLVNPGWEKSKEFSHHKIKALELMQGFSKHKAWGWKDPRNSLTLPFWKAILPSIKVVICLRNPLEVANSLLKRNYFSSASSFNLWLRYNQAILAYTESENRIITHYNSYFDDSSLEFSRLSNFLGLDLTKERIMEVCDTVKPTLHHNQFSFLDLIDKAPSEVTNLYKKMSDEASESPPLPITFPNPTMDFDNSLLRANSTEEQIKLLSKELANTKRDLHDKEKELSEIHKSKAWKFIQFIRALKQRTNL